MADWVITSSNGVISCVCVGGQWMADWVIMLLFSAEPPLCRLHSCKNRAQCVSWPGRKRRSKPGLSLFC